MIVLLITSKRSIEYHGYMTTWLINDEKLNLLESVAADLAGYCLELEVWAVFDVLEVAGELAVWQFLFLPVIAHIPPAVTRQSWQSYHDFPADILWCSEEFLGSYKLFIIIS